MAIESKPNTSTDVPRLHVNNTTVVKNPLSYTRHYGYVGRQGISILPSTYYAIDDGPLLSVLSAPGPAGARARASFAADIRAGRIELGVEAGVCVSITTDINNNTPQVRRRGLSAADPPLQQSSILNVLRPNRTRIDQLGSL